LPGRVRGRLTAAAVVCATGIGFGAVAAAPAQAASGDPRLVFSSTEEAATLTVADIVPALSGNHFDRMSVINRQGTPISVYAGANYTGTCTTYTASSDNQTFTLNTANGWGPSSVTIGLTCNQWPGLAYGTPVVIAATDHGTRASTYVPSNLALDVPGGSRDWGARTVTWTKNGGDNQRWFMKPVGEQTAQLTNTQADVTTYKLISVMGNDYANARCLEVAGANPQVGAAVETYACDPNAQNQPNQLWVNASAPGTQDSFTRVGIGARALRPSVQPGQLPDAADVPGLGYSNVWFNAAMMPIGSSVTNYPVLTQSATLKTQNGSTLTMEGQASGGDFYMSQTWWVEKIVASTNGGTGTGNNTVDNCPGMLTKLICGQN
jgi:hypothetical protein